jgi:hypothetical protein
MSLKPRTWILCIVCFGVLLYVGLRVSAESSDGYKFLDQTIRRAPQVQSRLGEVEGVKLSYFGAYRQRFVGSDRWLTMTFNVTGNRRGATIVASAKKVGGSWLVTSSSIDGEPISLN